MMFDDGKIHDWEGKRVKVIDVYATSSIENLQLSIDVFEDIRNGEHSKNIAVIKKGENNAVVYRYPSFKFIGITRDSDILSILNSEEQVLASIYPGEQVGNNLMKFKMFVILGDSISSSSMGFRSDKIVVNGNEIKFNKYNLTKSDIEQDDEYKYVELEASAFTWEVFEINSLIDNPDALFSISKHDLENIDYQLNFKEITGRFGKFRALRHSIGLSQKEKETNKYIEIIANNPNSCIGYAKELYKRKQFGIEDYQAVIRVSIPLSVVNDKTYKVKPGILGEKTLRDLIEHPLGDGLYESAKMKKNEVFSWMKEHGCKETIRELSTFKMDVFGTTYNDVRISEFEYHDTFGNGFWYSWTIPYGFFLDRAKPNFMETKEDLDKFIEKMVSDLNDYGVPLKLKQSSTNDWEYIGITVVGKTEYRLFINIFSSSAFFNFGITYNYQYANN